MITGFRYKDDVEGVKCPVAAHIRRSNPRDALDPTFGTPGANPDTALTNRRRIMRRGLPYGDPTAVDDGSEHGVIFIAICSSLFRQFEFIQQQWVQYGASFNVGNDTDPLVGLRRDGKKFVIPADPAKSVAPFICANIPQFVETRGGEYFFVPSLTALREITPRAASTRRDEGFIRRLRRLTQISLRHPARGGTGPRARRPRTQRDSRHAADAVPGFRLRGNRSPSPIHRRSRSAASRNI